MKDATPKETIHRNKQISQVTIKINQEDGASVDFFRHIQMRDREMYPTIFSYLNAAVQMLEVFADDGRAFPILTQADLELITNTMLDALRIYDTKKNERRMVP